MLPSVSLFIAFALYRRIVIHQDDTPGYFPETRQG